MYARLLLIHLPDRAAVLARLWDAVAPGGYLVVQDYDAAAFGVLPELPSVAELTRVIMARSTRPAPTCAPVPCSRSCSCRPARGFRTAPCHRPC